MCAEHYIVRNGANEYILYRCCIKYYYIHILYGVWTSFQFFFFFNSFSFFVIGSNVFHVLFYSLRLIFLFFIYIFFNSIRGFAFTIVFNKLWVMERSPHIAECRRMLNAAAPAATTITCVVVYLYLHFIIVYSVIELYTTAFART